MTLPPLSNRQKTVVAFISVLLLTAVVLISGNCLFESNDDMGMIRLLAGTQGIKAAPDAVFLALPLSALLYKLYAFTSAVPWYGLLMYSCLVTAGTIGLLTIFFASTTFLPRIICATAFLFFYLKIICRLNFSAVSLFLCFTVIAAIAAANLKEQPYSAKDIFFGCALGISYLIRPSLLPLFFLFSIPLAVTFIITPARKRLVATVAPLILAIVITFGASLLFRNSDEYRTYAGFNEIRAKYTDTHLAQPNVQAIKTIQALFRTGWTREDYLLTYNWWFHDAAIYNPETLARFMELNKESNTALISPADGIKSLYLNRFHLLIILLSFVPLLCKRAGEQDARPQQLIPVSCALLTTVVGFLLLTAIRFPPRVALPLFALLIIYGVVFRQYLAVGRSSNAIVKNCVTAICGIAIIGLIYQEWQFISKETGIRKLFKKETETSILAVQQRHGQNTIFLSANTGNAAFNAEVVSPLQEYRGLVPFTNFPMGWLIESPVYNAFLLENGFIDRNHVVPRMVNNSRLVLAFWESGIDRYDDFEKDFLYHLQTHYAAQFPGRNFKLQPILDRRNIIGNLGWIFFTINAAPTIESHNEL